MQDAYLYSFYQTAFQYQGLGTAVWCPSVSVPLYPPLLFSRVCRSERNRQLPRLLEALLGLNPHEARLDDGFVQKGKTSGGLEGTGMKCLV